MNGIGAAAIEVQDCLEQLAHEFCVIGGLAVVFWGSPRATQDVDVSLIVELGGEAHVAAQLLHQLEPRIDHAAAFAIESRMLLAKASNGVPIDIAFASFPMEQSMIRRAGKRELLPGLELRLISAEDLVVTKAIAARPQDISDVQSIVDRQGISLDRKQVLNDLTHYCELLETDEPLLLVNRMFADRLPDG